MNDGRRSMARWLAAALAAAALAGGARSATADAAGDAGRAIYNYRCYFCHGYSGDARTLAATFVSPPPRDFTAIRPTEIDRARMIDAVTRGRPGTAMPAFFRVLSTREIAAVVDFVRREFMQQQRRNTRYHTAANGWGGHERYRSAYPFATGVLALDTPWEALTADEVNGKRLFLTSCITCHDRARVADEGEIWRKQSVSYPRNHYSHTEPDAISAASVFASHDRSPSGARLSPAATRGRALWLQNCAFCHAADGSGENWIGSFLESPPRDLTDVKFMRGMSRDLLHERIRDGLANTSMPAWRNVLGDEEIEQIIVYIDEAFHPLVDHRTTENEKLRPTILNFEIN